MHIYDDIPPTSERKTLRDFIPLILAFFGGLVVLSLYQNLRLYFSGVLDSFLNKSFALLILHHTGFTALVALFLAFLFNYLENKTVGRGLKTVRIILMVLLAIEGLLIAFYVQNYEILGISIFGVSDSENIRFFLLPIVMMLLLTALIFHYLHKAAASFYKVISRMYPFTIILFSLFLATLNSEKKPINENKTQYLVHSMFQDLFDFNTYDGKEEFPLMRPHEPDASLTPYFNFNEEKPNIVVLIVEGLGSDFVGERARFKGFTPHLNTLREKSLSWDNFVSNSGTSFTSLPMLVGSLPFGENGFTNIPTYTNRHSLYSILKNNGYTTFFNYGGNSALNHVDKFLDEERVDHILDRNAFGADYQLQEKDAAGISLGYPDHQLFNKWNDLPHVEGPKFTIFQTLSTKNPFLIPDQEKYISKLHSLADGLNLSEQTRRIVDNNEEAFASFIYADKAIHNFIEDYKNGPDYNNTLFIITGSHNIADLPQVDELGRYRVPFLMFGPLLKASESLPSLASHADLAPSLVALLENTHHLKVPKNVAWLGNSLINKSIFDDQKNIPMFRDINNIQDFIKAKHYVSNGTYYVLSNHLHLTEIDDDSITYNLKKEFSHFKAINKYTTENNKIIPEGQSLLAKTPTHFSKTDLVWIESVFNGIDYDNAYNTARKLAFDKDWNRALLLCKFILSKTPRHADTEILMGRIYSWQEKYQNSEEILKEALRKYPKYEDGYAALLDTYFWADTNDKSMILLNTIHRHEIDNNIINEKIARAKHHISKDSTLDINPNSPK